MEYDIFDIDPLSNTIFDEIRYDNYLMEEAYNDGIKFYEDTLNQASTNGPDKSENIFKKLWNAAIQFIKWIGRILGKIKNFLFGSKAPKQSMSGVADAAAAKSNTIKPDSATFNNSGDSSSLSNIIPNASVKNNVVNIPVEVIDNNGTTTTIDFSAILNPVKIIFSDNKPFVEFTLFGEMMGSIKSTNKLFADTGSSGLNIGEKIKNRLFGRETKNTSFLDDALARAFYWLKPKSNTFDVKIERYEKIVDAMISNNGRALESLLANENSYNSNYSKAESLDNKFDDCQITHQVNSNNVKMPVDIPLIQERIEKISKLVEKIRNFDISIYSKNTNMKKFILEFMNDLTSFLSVIQYGFNSLMYLFKGIYHIDVSYYGCIHTKEDLAIMAEEIVKAAIPTKWAYNNIVLLCDKNLRGAAKAYNPVIGQSRVVIFPKNEGNNVIKVAGNRLGLDANRSEYNTSDTLMGKYNELGNYLAKVNWISDNGMVITMEKGVENATEADRIAANALRDEINKILNKHGETLQIGDMHPGNVMYFSRGKKNLKAIDYGWQRV